jgi:hypothetical protein
MRAFFRNQLFPSFLVRRIHQVEPGRTRPRIEVPMVNAPTFDATPGSASPPLVWYDFNRSVISV